MHAYSIHDIEISLVGFSANTTETIFPTELHYNVVEREKACLLSRTEAY
jgi:hypothetical protein